MARELALLESMRLGELTLPLLGVALSELAQAVLENSPLCVGYKRWRVDQLSYHLSPDLGL